MGRVIAIDLTTGESRDYPWSDEDRRTWVGGNRQRGWGERGLSGPSLRRRLGIGEDSRDGDG